MLHLTRRPFRRSTRMGMLERDDAGHRVPQVRATILTEPLPMWLLRMSIIYISDINK